MIIYVLISSANLEIQAIKKLVFIYSTPPHAVKHHIELRLHTPAGRAPENWLPWVERLPHPTSSADTGSSTEGGPGRCEPAHGDEIETTL